MEVVGHRGLNGSGWTWEAEWRTQGAEWRTQGAEWRTQGAEWRTQGAEWRYIEVLANQWMQ